MATKRDRSDQDIPVTEKKKKEDSIEEDPILPGIISDDSKYPCRRSFLEASAAEDRGLRQTMEDVWVIRIHGNSANLENVRHSYFAIFDGHGGRKAAEFAKENLLHNVASLGLEPSGKVDLKLVKKAILDGVKKTDEELLRQSENEGWQDGATAVCLWIIDRKAIVANLGDAKAVLARSSLGSEPAGKSVKETLKGVVLTKEHKAIFPLERARIEKSGGFVSKEGRLQGRVEVSRAFGDRPFKKLGLIATPDITAFELTEREKFIILGCDGLWGVFGATDAVEFVDKQLKEGATTEMACRRLVKEAIRERKCKDNCTAVLITLHH